MEFERRRCRNGAASGSLAYGRRALDQRGQGFAPSRRENAGHVDAGEAPGGHHFSIFRADSVSVTSTRFTGGDWRWRLSDRLGAILVEAGGYRSEARCREAVAILQTGAARATVA